MEQLQIADAPQTTLWSAKTQLTSLSQNEEQVAAGLDILPQTERLVLSLLYVEELTVLETAVVMDRQEIEICQIHDRALKLLSFSMRAF